MQAPPGRGRDALRARGAGTPRPGGGAVAPDVSPALHRREVRTGRHRRNQGRVPRHGRRRRAADDSDPAAPNYVTATSSCGVPLKVEYRSRGMAPRPRWKALTVIVGGGYLSEGDVITVVFGDTSRGSPGMRMQTMAEAAFEFKVLADVCAVGPLLPRAEHAHSRHSPRRARAVESGAAEPSPPRRTLPFRRQGRGQVGQPHRPRKRQAPLRADSGPVDGLPAEYDYPARAEVGRFRTT